MQVVDFVHVLLHYGDNTRHFNAQQKLMFAGGGGTRMRPARVLYQQMRVTRIK